MATCKSAFQNLTRVWNTEIMVSNEIISSVVKIRTSVVVAQFNWKKTWFCLIFIWCIFLKIVQYVVLIRCHSMMYQILQFNTRNQMEYMIIIKWLYMEHSFLSRLQANVIKNHACVITVLKRILLFSIFPFSPVEKKSFKNVYSYY